MHVIETEEFIQLSAINDVTELDRSELKRIFDRTFRLDTSRTNGQLGLGLHIVQQLINHQGGKVIANVHNHEFRMEVSFKKWHEGWE